MSSPPPDALVVQDPTLLHQVGLFAGLKPGGSVLINTGRSVDELGLSDLDARILTVPASDIARRHLGRPLPGAALLGAFVARHRLISLASVATAFRERFRGPVGAQNAAAAEEAFAHVAALSAELTHA